ncbi:MAG: deoxynucleoside kinase [Bacteroidota bacterium]|nr:deoxynucleoside kinase [Bacteroidota bacterium]MEC9209400.1 deoxynucleoside kinase [Bacteroidota bacterium]
MQYKHIAIEGNIGSGKTTLVTMLAADYKVRLILEAFADNPFLPKFYEAPDKHAFPLELFFMAERYHQLKNLKEQDLFQPQMISDYFFVKSKLFAQNNLQHDELQLFNRLFDIMSSSLSQPDLLVYLYADIVRLQQNIKKRGREFEQNISDAYLQNIQDKYLDYLRKQNDFPVLVLDITKVDFVAKKDVYESIKGSIMLPYETGMHHKVVTTNV